VEVIRTALGDLVDHAAERTAEFRAVTTGLDLLFLDRFERNLREVEVAERVGDVEAVEEVLVLGDGRAAERSQVAERRVAAHRAGREQRDAGGVARTGIFAICSAVRMVVDSTEVTSIGLIAPVPTTSTSSSSCAPARAARKSTFADVPTLTVTLRGVPPLRVTVYWPIGNCEKRIVPSAPTVIVREKPVAGLVTVMVSPTRRGPPPHPRVGLGLHAADEAEAECGRERGALEAPVSM
jgi:hypothetical protein